MSPASRRSTGIRRPRVAGRAAPGTEVLDPPAPRAARAAVSTVTVRPADDEQQPAVVGDADLEPTVVTGPEPVATARATPRKPKAQRDRAPRRPLSAVFSAPTSTRALSVWGATALVLVAAAAFFGMSWYNATFTGPVANRALVDIGATAQVSQQVGEDLKTIYSFDYTRLDQNEKDARAVITPDFGTQFDKIFADVRARAPQQQAVVTATIANTAVRELSGDHAVVVVFMDQVATRTGSDKVASSGRLTVSAQLIDGQWKIADVKAV